MSIENDVKLNIQSIDSLKLNIRDADSILNTLKNATDKDPYLRDGVRNRLNAAVNRYVKEAKKHLLGIEKGIFPAV